MGEKREVEKHLFSALKGSGHTLQVRGLKYLKANSSHSLIYFFYLSLRILAITYGKICFTQLLLLSSLSGHLH